MNVSILLRIAKIHEKLQRVEPLQRGMIVQFSSVELMFSDSQQAEKFCLDYCKAIEPIVEGYRLKTENILRDQLSKTEEELDAQDDEEILEQLFW